MEETRFANRLQGFSSKVISEILKLTQQPDIISFAGGMPAPDAFPTDELAELAEYVIRQRREAVLQYGVTEGFYPLRDWIARWISQKGLRVRAENVLITTGSQQGIDLVAKALVNPQDKVVVERPTYLTAIQIFRSYEACFLVTPYNQQGVDVPALEALIEQEQPKVVYLVPTFQNPSGQTLPLENRRDLADMLTRHQVVLLEDDPYADLRYSGEPLPAIMGMDQTGQAIYLGSFSKIISPGLRVGFAVATGELFDKLVIGKQVTDINTSNLSQALVYEFCSRGYLEPHIGKISSMYKEKCRKMQAAIKQYMPNNIQWTVPEGGLFIWGELPADIDSKAVMQEAVKHKVAFIPGESFFADGTGQNTMRLNFSNAALADIEIGIMRLAGVLQQFMPVK